MWNGWILNLGFIAEIVDSLATENYDTLHFLFRHLLNITEYRDSNRMHISNLAIVFGPTLMWAATASNNLALDMMQQNLVVEALLNHFHSIFAADTVSGAYLPNTNSSSRWFTLKKKRL